MSMNDVSWWGDIWVKAQLLLPPAFGSVVTIWMGKDFSYLRITGGLASGIFVAWYGTDIVLHFISIPPSVDPGKAYAAVGGLLGATGHAIISRLIETIQTGDLRLLLGKTADKKGGE